MAYLGITDPLKMQWRVRPYCARMMEGLCQAKMEQCMVQGFEILRAVKLVPEPFGIAEGLMTPTFKLKRAQLQQQYQAVIDVMYRDLKS